ncbi:efflux RND transporter periplasmic adaptor subunit [Saccharicrinis sp. FJH62]|uniref:efflux RND transporter periplasmic adaptor subunit n=1 Tax=Saccharicrinis sp. FJH62 TaxID=3344657 RepID=UPI0035D4E1DF
MKKLLYLLLVSGVFVTSACKPGEKKEEESGAKNTEIKKDEAAPEVVAPKDKTYNVRVMTLAVDTLENSIDYTATLAAFEEVHFASASPGRIQKIYVEVGDHVKKGDLIAEMDKTQLMQARIQLENAKVNYQRLKALKETNSISDQQFDQVKTQYDVTKSNVDFLEENTRLVSPINGVVTGKYFENGEMYSGAPNTQAGKAAIVSLMQIDPLKAIVNVSEAYFPDVYEGMKADVKLDIYPKKMFVGEVFRIYPTLDPMSRTFKVEIKLNNKGEKLRPGMFSRVSLDLGTYKTIVIPSIALMQQEGTNDKYVFIAENGIAHKIKVKTGKRFNDKIEIIANEIKPGVKLIVTGQGNLMDQYKVKIVD